MFPAASIRALGAIFLLSMGNELQKPKESVPLGVWVFWIIVLLIGAVWFFLSVPNGMTILGFVIQVLTAVAGAVAAIAALRTVRISNEALNQARADRERELDLKRPNIAFVEGSTSYTRDNKKQLHATFKNTGIHSARNISVQIIFLNTQRKDIPEYSIQISIANDVASQFTFPIHLVGIALEKEHVEESYYIGFLITFQDAVTRKDYTQPLFLECPRFGFAEGGNLIHMSGTDKELIIRHLNQAAWSDIAFEGAPNNSLNPTPR